MKPTPAPWTLGRTSKRSQTVYIDAMHSDPDLKHVDWREMIACSGCHDLPDKGIQKAGANARFVVKAVNYHERLREALDKATKRSKLDWMQEALDILAELDNLENGS